MLDVMLPVRFRALALSTGRNDFPDRWLLVDISRQQLGLMEGLRLLRSFPISTAKAGVGCEENSYRTPTGWHRIRECLGEGQALGRVFRSRLATEDLWQGEAREEDLILTRILRLEGLEEGHNRGAGVDSWERMIYLHGTNQEDLIGQAVSHGCIRLRNADMLELFALVQAGDPVFLSARDRADLGHLHFVGIGGSGMSALAQFARMRGTGRVSGSDRSFDRGQNPLQRAQLEKLGIEILPQDGSAVDLSCSAVIYSTAVEASVPDFAQAQELGIPLLHRSELLAHWVREHRTLAVTGTSGKSTTTALLFELLRGVGRDPSLITGGELRSLQETGHWGNAWAGSSDWLVIEADESDGSLVRYEPELGLVLNLQRDHKEPEIVAEMFRTFRSHCRAFVVADEGNLAEFTPDARLFGFGDRAWLRPENLHLEATGSRFRIRGVDFHLPLPGRHNMLNALAALTACVSMGVELEGLVEPMAAFRGVARRFQIVGEARGITVVDDFAHNPAKVAASLTAAQARASRVLAIYQPHGFAPTRFLWKDFVESFGQNLRAQDRLWMLEVFYAGGTAQRDFSAADLVADMVAHGICATFAPSREELLDVLAAETRSGDLILLMGARDPSLSHLARTILDHLACSGCSPKNQQVLP